MKNSMRPFFSLFLLVFCLSKVGICETLNVEALGCVVSLPDVQNVSVSGSGDITFFFQEQTNNRPQTELIIFTKYPGDEAWFGESSRSTRSHSSYLSFDQVLVTINQTNGANIVYRGLTNKKIVVYFKNTSSDLGQYIKCETP